MTLSGSESSILCLLAQVPSEAMLESLCENITLRPEVLRIAYILVGDAGGTDDEIAMANAFKHYAALRRSNSLQDYADNLKEFVTSRPPTFTEKFNEGLMRLGLDKDDRKAADVFDTSLPTLRRWKSGAVIPPGWNVVLSIMLQLINEEIAKLKEK